MKGYNENQINKEVVKYFYTLLDLYGEAKHKIIMPQTKLLDFISRQRIHKEVAEDKGLSYESLVNLIAKDRKRLNDHLEGKSSLLGYEPEHILNLLVTEKEAHKNYIPEID